MRHGLLCVRVHVCVCVCVCVCMSKGCLCIYTCVRMRACVFKLWRGSRYGHARASEGPKLMGMRIIWQSSAASITCQYFCIREVCFLAHALFHYNKFSHMFQHLTDVKKPIYSISFKRYEYVA
jgi:hypothetical protein